MNIYKKLCLMYNANKYGCKSVKLKGDLYEKNQIFTIVTNCTTFSWL